MRESIFINVNNLKDAENIVKILNKFDFDILASDQYFNVDAKSLLCVCTLEIDDPIRLSFESKDADDIDIDRLKMWLKNYIVEVI